jgi:hypothetical protein
LELLPSATVRDNDNWKVLKVGSKWIMSISDTTPTFCNESVGHSAFEKWSRQPDANKKSLAYKRRSRQGLLDETFLEELWKIPLLQITYDS